MNKFLIFGFLLIGAIGIGACNSDKSLTVPLPCNGYSELCFKRYNEVTYAGTHNGHAYAPVFHAFAANQNFGITAQLEAGVRLINIKVYYDDDACGDAGIYVYHGFPEFGCEPYSKVLGEIKDFMTANAREVVTITIEGSASIWDIVDGFETAGLTQYFYHHEAGTEWPILKELISGGQRLIVMAHHSNSEEAGIRNMWSEMFDTHYQASVPEEFSCDKDRGDHDASLFLLNHFITNLSPQPPAAEIINQENFLLNRALDCWQANNQRPNYLMVDFYDVGDVVEVADSLNLRTYF